MSHDDLRRLAEHGVSGFPPSEIPTLADWCEDYCFAANEASFCLLAKTLRTISAVWDGPVRTQKAAEIDRIVARRLGAFLDSKTTSGRMAEARFFADEIATSSAI